MEFEFDPHKSEINKKKHGIDFVEAQWLWEDTDLLEVPAKTEEEPRFLVVGRIGAKHWCRRPPSGLRKGEMLPNYCI